jgi:hypothetical protein
VSEERIENNLVIVTSDRGVATFSLDRRYRYSLERYITPRDEVEANDRDLLVTFVMLNPSTADAFADDRTIAKCIRFARAWGADSLRVVNLFALRATKPKELYKCGGAEFAGHNVTNDTTIRAAAIAAWRVVAAWGTHGKLWHRHELVRGATGPLDGIELHHLGLSDDGYPKHPLYRPDATEPELWA